MSAALRAPGGSSSASAGGACPDRVVVAVAVSTSTRRLSPSLRSSRRAGSGQRPPGAGQRVATETAAFRSSARSTAKSGTRDFAGVVSVAAAAGRGHLRRMRAGVDVRLGGQVAGVVVGVGPRLGGETGIDGLDVVPWPALLFVRFIVFVSGESSITLHACPSIYHCPCFILHCSSKFCGKTDTRFSH
jgi:hypothetical protein